MLSLKLKQEFLEGVSGQRYKEQVPQSWTATYFLGLLGFLVSKFRHTEGSKTPMNEPLSQDYYPLTPARGGGSVLT